MQIVHKLNLNKHLGECDNNSLVDAHNVKVSKDGSYLTNEELIYENTLIRNYIADHFTNPVIVGVIPCNTELVLIVNGSTSAGHAKIFRYREATDNQTEGIKLAYGNNSDKYFDYHGGQIKGDFTYNAEGSLIVAIAEYGVNGVTIPLRTINLGNYDDTGIPSDVDLIPAKHSVVPEVFLPQLSNIKYIQGNAYKGWYYIFIRYKINSIDYTQWYSIGLPIYIDSIEPFNIIKYAFNRKIQLGGGVQDEGSLYEINIPKDVTNDGFGVGCADSFSREDELCNKTFNFDLVFNNSLGYEYYQLGIINISKAYSHSFQTNDISIEVNNYTFSSNNIHEQTIDELITAYYNYYNVGNIKAYENKLYISNYNEASLSPTINDNIVDNVNVKVSVNVCSSNDIFYNHALVSKNVVGINDQYACRNDSYIRLDEFLNIAGTDQVTVTLSPFDALNPYVTDIASNFIIIPQSNVIGKIKVVHDGTTNFIGLVDIYYDNVNGNHIIIDTSDTSFIKGTPYIKTDSTFDSRIKNKTLLPGEVYNFFIHFVDKYGHATNGFKLNNKYRWYGQSTAIEVVPIKVVTPTDTYYAAIPIDNTVSILDNNQYILNTDGIEFYSSYSINNFNCELTGLVDSSLVIDYFNIAYKYYANSKYSNIKWYQITPGIDEHCFYAYYNSVGDRLFKVPVEHIQSSAYTTYNLDISGVTIPQGYLGYFISCEKMEKHIRCTGFLTRNDFVEKDYISVDNEIGTSTVIGTEIRPSINSSKSDKMCFYTSEFDIADKLKLDYDLLRIDGVSVFDKDDLPQWEFYQRNKAYNYLYDMNKPQILGNNVADHIAYPIPNFYLATANSAKDNRMGVGTCLYINDDYNLFPTYVPTLTEHNLIVTYKASLINISNTIYTSKHKQLVRISEIYYNTDSVTIIDGLNGFFTYDGFLVYSNKGLVFLEGRNIATESKTNKQFYPSMGIDANGDPIEGFPSDFMYHSYQVDNPFGVYIQMGVYSDVPKESKCFNNPPDPIIYNVYTDYNIDDESVMLPIGGFILGSMVLPQNSIDLFKQPQVSNQELCPKVYSNVIEDNIDVTRFDKTLRRSFAIQDETRENNWRKFNVDSYKMITDNRGIITNLIGIGTIFLVHTEHSLFVFDTSNVLQTKGQNVQLAQQDVFDLRYKEVFTSDLGFGGLQDDRAYIVDTFGYIFYSNDSHRFIRFDNNGVKYIDDDIYRYNKKVKPYNIRFANDKPNNRLLIRYEYKNTDTTISRKVLSYNYATNTFISFHDYDFDTAYNTKNECYMFLLYGDAVKSHVYNISRDNSDYGWCSNYAPSNYHPTNIISYISIINNQLYDDIKYLETIRYKLRKLTDLPTISGTYNPVEGDNENYAGDYLTVFNDCIDTGRQDIKIDTFANRNVFSKYDKPYWHLGNWNFSHLRNNITERSQYGDNDTESRLYGNYFILKFEFINLDKKKVEFESLDCNLQQVKTI